MLPSAEEAVYRLYGRLRAHQSSLRAVSLRETLTEARAVMELCLEHHMAIEAFAVYQAVCSCGLVASLSPRRHDPLGQLALAALQRLPHHSHNAKILSQLMDAEHEWDLRDAPLSTDWGGVIRHDSRLVWRGIPKETPPVTSMTQAETFRRHVRQSMRVLRTAGYSHLILGRNFLLSEVFNVMNAPKLKEQVEVGPLWLLASRLLDHPFTYATPSWEWARRLTSFEDLGLSVTYAGNMSKALEAHVIQLEASISTVRSTRCPDTLSFLCASASGWDELFLRRVAETLVLPTEAHDVFPPAYREWQRQRKQPPTAHHTNSKHRQPLALLPQTSRGEVRPAEKWTDPSHELFTNLPGRTPVEAVQRAEAILRRRVHHDIVVPDTLYILNHMPQLQQLACHREVVVPHGVLLGIVRVASHGHDPRRFRARSALKTLMENTTTSRTCSHQPTYCPSRGVSRSSSSSSSPCEGGVTVLGLQDELALLDECRERFYFAETQGDAECESRHREMGETTPANASLSAVLVAKQLGRMVHAHSKGMSLQEVTGVVAPAAANEASRGLAQSFDTDAVVEGIMSAFLHENESSKPPAAATLQGSGKSNCGGGTAPLFQTPSRAYWAHAAVIVATTSPETRVSAYMIGLNTFPPTCAHE